VAGKGIKMNVRFEPKDPAPVAEEYIMVNGRGVGTVRKRDRYTDGEEFMAVLELPNSTCAFGYGDTKESAVSDAIRKARVLATDILNTIANLVCEMNGSEATNG
jgi:hypothetical protein